MFQMINPRLNRIELDQPLQQLLPLVRGLCRRAGGDLVKPALNVRVLVKIHLLPFIPSNPWIAGHIRN